MIADIMENKKFQTKIQRLASWMQEIEYFTCVYHLCFSVPKDVRLNDNTLFDYENQQQKTSTKYCN